MQVELALVFAVVTGLCVVAMLAAILSEFRWKRSIEDRLKTLEKASAKQLHQKLVEAKAAEEEERETPVPLRKLVSSRPPPPP